MSMRESLVEAMHLPPDSDTVEWLHERGVAMADQETMSQAIHDVYCGITADHDHPSEKDHEQARALIRALQQQAKR
jgi:alpha-D-ribose 1-methylphosphonate 5-triphosphate diphosphatase PhnM